MIARLLPAAALLLAAGIASAQTQTAPAPATPPAAPPAAPAAPAPNAAAPTTPQLSKAEQAAVEKRIKALQTELAITPDQMPLWNAFAQRMRDNAAQTEALFQRRAAVAGTMNAVDNMRSYAEIARAYADEMDRLATDFASLYASLSDLQKRAADGLFRKQAAAPR